MEIINNRKIEEILSQQKTVDNVQITSTPEMDTELEETIKNMIAECACENPQDLASLISRIPRKYPSMDAVPLSKNADGTYTDESIHRAAEETILSACLYGEIYYGTGCTTHTDRSGMYQHMEDEDARAIMQNIDNRYLAEDLKIMSVKREADKNRLMTMIKYMSIFSEECARLKMVINYSYMVMKKIQDPQKDAIVAKLEREIAGDGAPLAKNEDGTYTDESIHRVAEYALTQTERDDETGWLQVDEDIIYNRFRNRDERVIESLTGEDSQETSTRCSALASKYSAIFQEEYNRLEIEPLRKAALAAKKWLKYRGKAGRNRAAKPHKLKIVRFNKKKQ